MYGSIDQRPTLVMLAGLPGTGKTALATALSAMLGWVVLDKDLIHSGLLADGLDAARAGPLAYTVTLDLVADIVVRQRQSVILDTAGRQPLVLARSREIAERGAARLVVLRCVAPASVRATRLAGRTPLPSQWATDQATDVDQERWYAHLPGDTLVLDTQLSLEDCVRRALALIADN
jgi:predicted kinase